jgi:hypothetical protein
MGDNTVNLENLENPENPEINNIKTKEEDTQTNTTHLNNDEKTLEEDPFKKKIDADIANYKNKINQFEQQYKASTKRQHRLLNERKQQIKTEIQDEEILKQDYLKQKNRETTLNTQVQAEIYKGNTIKHKKMMYLGITSIHILAIIILILGLCGILNHYIAVIVILVFYTFIVLIYYYKMGDDENRNAFNFFSYDDKYEKSSCKFIQGASRGDVKKRELKAQEEKKTADIVNRMIQENEKSDTPNTYNTPTLPTTK